MLTDNTKFIWNVLECDQGLYLCNKVCNFVMNFLLMWSDSFKLKKKKNIKDVEEKGERAHGQFNPSLILLHLKGLTCTGEGRQKIKEIYN